MSKVQGALLALVVAAVLGAVIFGGPVVRWYQNRLADAQDEREHAIDDSVGRELEVVGTEELSEAAAKLESAAADIRRETHVVEVRTRADPAVRALPRIPPSELERLRAHDRLLCERSPRLCGPGGAAAADSAAPDREGAVSP